MENNETNAEVWQVEANGQRFDSNLAEMTQWIADGALLRIDRVRKGNLRWIEAGKVPALIEFFNAKDLGVPIVPVVTTTTAVLGQSEPPASAGGQNLHYVDARVQPPATACGSATAPNTEPICSVHPDALADYVCDTCSNLFCRACPSSYGGTVKICPFCGALCKSLVQAEKARTDSQTYTAAMGEGFGFGDFASGSLAYPFRFKASLIMGGIMFMLFSIGKSAGGFGNIFLMGAAIFCYMLANTLTFGILANTVENFSQGKIGENFMPSFDDFSIWDDVVHPFFLSIGVYIASFGPLVAVLAIAFFMMLNAVKTETSKMQTGGVAPLAYAANSVQQGQKVQELLQKTQDMQKKRMAAIERENEQRRDALEQSWAAAESGQATTVHPYTPPPLDEEAEFQQLNQMVQDTRKAQIESTVGKAPETVTAEQTALVTKLLGYGAIFILAAGICVLWGLFYFPAACAVAGYTRSFVATLNPSVGLDTIRRLGLNYVKILLMGAVIIVVLSIVNVFLNTVFVVFDLPTVGNLPAQALGSLFSFYFSVVFSCVIGFAIYKAGERLRLYR